MDAQQIGTVRLMTWMFLVAGVAGLLISASISTWYLEQLPRMPVPAEMRMTPRSVEGTVVYVTMEEDKTLTLTEYLSMGAFVAGVCFGLVNLRQRGLAYAMSAEPDEYSEDAP